MLEAGTNEWAAELLSRWRASRNPEALGQLLKWQRDRAYATALKILGNEADAEDAVQQSFMKLLSRTQGFDTVPNFRIAVYRATVQCALDVARANRVRSKLEKAMSPVDTNSSPMPQLAAEQAEQLKLVWQELHAMPEDSRAMVVLCYQEGLSVSDAAEILSVPRETLRDRLAASMSDLRRKLNQRGVALSLLLLVTLLQHGKAQAAPAGLCEALDVSLPGPSCANVPVAQAPVVPPEALIVGTSSGGAAVISLPVKIGLGLAATVAMVAGMWLSTPDTPVKSQVAARRNTPTTTSAVIASPTRQAPANEEIRIQTFQPLQRAEVEVGQADRQIVAIQREARQEAGQAAARPVNPNEVPLDQVPVHIRKAAQGAIKGLGLISAEREEKPPGSYEFKAEFGGKIYEILVDAKGTVLKVQEDRDDDEDNGVKPQRGVPPPAPPVDF